MAGVGWLLVARSVGRPSGRVGYAGRVSEQAGNAVVCLVLNVLSVCIVCASCA